MLNEKLLKLLHLLTSRKFIASVVALLVVFQVLPEGEESGVIEAVSTVIVAVGYIIGVAIEDAGAVNLSAQFEVEEGEQG